MNLPARIQENPLAWAADAKALVAKVDDLGTLREMQDQARAVVAYLNGKLGRATEEARAAAEVELRVKRRIGELLPPPEQGGRGKLAEARRVSPDLDHRRASEFRKLAEVPAEAFEGYLEEQREAEKPPSTAGALRKAPPPAAKREPKGDELLAPVEFAFGKALTACVDAEHEKADQLTAAARAFLAEAIPALQGMSRKAAQLVMRAKRTQ